MAIQSVIGSVEETAALVNKTTLPLPDGTTVQAVTHIRSSVGRFAAIVGNKAQATSEICLYFPSTINAWENGKKHISVIPAKARRIALGNVVKSFVTLFGGATIKPVQGAWFSDETKSIVHEDIDIVSSFTGTLTAQDCKQVLELALAVKSAFGQDAVLVTVDGKAWFI